MTVDWRAELKQCLDPATLLSSVIAGLVAGVLAVTFMFSYSAVIFTGELADYVPRATGQVGDDEADAGNQFLRMPFDFGHDTTLPVPASSLIAETGIVSEHPLRRATDGPGQQMADAFLEHLVLWYTDRVQEAFGFEVLVNLR